MDLKKGVTGSLKREPLEKRTQNRKRKEDLAKDLMAKMSNEQKLYQIFDFNCAAKNLRGLLSSGAMKFERTVMGIRQLSSVAEVKNDVIEIHGNAWQLFVEMVISVLVNNDDVIAALLKAKRDGKLEKGTTMVGTESNENDTPNPE